jgi:hypothetical protein
MTVSCEYCRKKIKENEEIVLLARYPRHRARAQIDGKIYHRACFVNMLKNEQGDVEQ